MYENIIAEMFYNNRVFAVQSAGVEHSYKLCVPPSSQQPHYGCCSLVPHGWPPHYLRSTVLYQPEHDIIPTKPLQIKYIST